MHYKRNNLFSSSAKGCVPTTKASGNLPTTLAAVGRVTRGMYTAVEALCRAMFTFYFKERNVMHFNYLESNAEEINLHS